MTNQSLSDKRMIDELTKGRERLLSGSSPSRLLSILRRRLQSITKNVYVFDWIPEQLEEVYYVLVDGKTVVHVEIPRNGKDGEMIFEMWPVAEFLKVGHSPTRTTRRRLELAIELAQRKSGRG